MSKERKTCQNWKKNLIFTAVILLAAALIGGFYMVRRADKPDKVAHLVYGTIERTQTDIDLREDADYTFQSNGYEIHLQVRDGALLLWTVPARIMSVSSLASCARSMTGRPAFRPRLC